MPTLTKPVTSSYDSLSLPTGTDIFIQNRGSETVEINFSTTAPGTHDEGIALTPGSAGISVAISVGEQAYAKTEGADNVSLIICVY